jgi:nicotinamidase-related amidase
MLQREDTILVVVDVQGKLAQLMHHKSELFENLRRMIQGARILGVPILVTEQYPQGIGPTVAEIADLLTDVEVISKTSFSCCGEKTFTAALQGLNRRQILLTGIETHICVHQTALQLIDAGYEVQVVADAVSSRTLDNKRIGLAKMQGAGAVITSTETALYELLKAAEGPMFKAVLGLVK